MTAELEGITGLWRKSPVSSLPPNEVMLVTDFDGTLAEIGPDPARSVALPGALDALRRLARMLKQVVVLSSRTADDLSRLVPVAGVRLIADSGLHPLIKANGLLGAQGRKVIEVHSLFGGKGAALAALLDEVDPAGVIAMGDDENDRAAFELLSARALPHLTIGVSSEEVPPDLFARCDVVVDGPEQATLFLHMLADWAAGAEGS